GAWARVVLVATPETTSASTSRTVASGSCRTSLFIAILRGKVRTPALPSTATARRLSDAPWPRNRIRPDPYRQIRGARDVAVNLNPDSSVRLLLLHRIQPHALGQPVERRQVRRQRLLQLVRLRLQLHFDVVENRHRVA